MCAVRVVRGAGWELEARGAPPPNLVALIKGDASAGFAGSAALGVAAAGGAITVEADAAFGATPFSASRLRLPPLLPPELGVATAEAALDAFCVEQDCVIRNVFDQSPMGNHLGPRHKLVNASQHKITVGDEVEVYGM